MELTGLEEDNIREYQVKVEKTFSDLFREAVPRPQPRAEPLQEVFYQSPDLQKQKTPEQYIYQQKSSEVVHKSYHNKENSPLQPYVEPC